MNRQVRHDFLPSELLDLGHRLARQEKALAAVKDEKATKSKLYGKQIKRIEEAIAELSGQIDAGYEFRDVEDQTELFADAPVPVTDKPRRERKQ